MNQAAIIAILVGMTPLITKVPFVNSSVAVAYVIGPIIWLWFLSALAVSLWIGTEDRWLGFLCCWYSTMLLWNVNQYAVEVVQQVIFGFMLLVVARKWFDRNFFVRVLEIVGCLEASLVVLQFFGRDLSWDGLVLSNFWPGGTFGNRTYVAAFFSMLIPVASVPAMLMMLVGLVCTKSVTGCLAATLGLLVRWPQWRWKIACVGTPAVLVALWFHNAPLVSLMTRINVWLMAFSYLDWKTVLMGNGPGMWFKMVPVIQMETKTELTEGASGFAHNDLIQLFFDAGLVALVPVLVWLILNRRLFLNPQKGSLVSLLLTCQVMFPFHLVTLGVPAACLIGVLTKKEEEDV